MRLWRIPTLSDFSTLIAYPDEVEKISFGQGLGFMWTSTKATAFRQYTLALTENNISITTHHHQDIDLSMIIVRTSYAHLQWGIFYQELSYGLAIEECMKINQEDSYVNIHAITPSTKEA